jgi:hypothetical protein
MSKNTFDDLFKSDKDTVELPVGYNSKEEEVFLIIAESGSKAHRVSQRKHNQALERSRNNEKRRNKVFATIVAESILLDWKGMLDEKGNPIECTVENKIAKLLEYDKLMMAVVEASTEFANFKNDAEIDEETEKN